jgi:hypothetical protein
MEASRASSNSRVCRRTTNDSACRKADGPVYFSEQVDWAVRAIASGCILATIQWKYPARMAGAPALQTRSAENVVVGYRPAGTCVGVTPFLMNVWRKRPIKRGTT